MTDPLGKNKPQLWYCPHCEKLFKTTGVAFTLTVNCPNCGHLQNIRELHNAGRKLIYAGLAAWGRMISLTDDLDPVDEEDAAFVAEFNAVKRIVREAVNTLARDVEVLMYARNHSDHVKEEREQDSFFEKNPSATISKGKVTPL